MHVNDSSEPSAPPAPFEGPLLEQSIASTSLLVVVDHPLNRSTSGEQRSRVLSRDSRLFQDLVRHTDGDPTKIAKCFRELGDEVTVEEVCGELARYDNRVMETDDIDKEASLLNAPSIYFCPISFHLLRDPVLLSTGQTYASESIEELMGNCRYERRFIQKWLKEGGSICPITGMELTKPVALTSNVALRQAIEEWASVNASWMLGANGHLLPIKEGGSEAPVEGAVDTDGDVALAVHLQQNELPPRPRTRERQRYRRPVELSRSQHIRIRRCVALLLLITLMHFLMFMYTLYRGDWEFEKIDSNPLIGFDARTIRRVGGTNMHQISKENEWWRIATSAIMTGGIIHLQWVVCCLWICGRFLASRMSLLPLALIYVVSSVVGVLTSANLSVDVETVAASAGAFGFIGAVAIEILVHRKHYQHHFISLGLLSLLATVGVLIGTTPFVDNWASIGGLLSGLCLTLALRLTHKGLQRSTPCLECILVAIQVFWFLLVGAFVLAGCIGLFIKTDNRQDCQWCQKITCVEVEWWDCHAAIAPPDGLSCHYNIKGDLTTDITCPSGFTKTVQLKEISDENLERRCEDVCGLKKKGKGRGGRDQSIGRLPETSKDDDTSLGRNNIEQSKTE